jgi:hypothetical protein
MKRRFTVVWSSSARARLAELWLDNPAVRHEITEAVNALDAALSKTPANIGVPAAPGAHARLVVNPPISLTYVVRYDDREVRITGVKFWDD